MIAKIYTASCTSSGGFLVQVEVSILPGQMGIQIVGLGDNAVKESKERIRSSILNSGFDFPVQNIIVNLAPNDQPKIGSIAELAISVGILIASGQCPGEIFANHMLLGSLSLDGNLQASNGIFMSAILGITEPQIHNIIVPYEIKDEIASIPNVRIYSLQNLSQIKDYAQGKIKQIQNKEYISSFNKASVDMVSVFGQNQAKRGLAFAAIGGHHSILFGSPGTGKTMLVNAFEGILPKMSLEESLEVTKIYSIKKKVQNELISKRPFRIPHHTTSEIAMVGGGSYLLPGEISLAHKGILFLDELFEFKNTTLQALREPLEEKNITISRAKGTVYFPADFIFMGASNPCKCGYLFSNQHICICKKSMVNNLFQKISGPFEDRISIEIEMEELSSIVELKNNSEKPSYFWRSKVEEARKRMLKRNNGIANADMQPTEVYKYVDNIPNIKNLLADYMKHFELSHRSLLNTLKTAMSIQDFSESDQLKIEHIEEAFYFKLFRKLRSQYQKIA